MVLDMAVYFGIKYMKAGQFFITADVDTVA